MEGFLREMGGFFDIGLSPENLVKLIFLLQDNNTKEMTQIEASYAEFAVGKMERIKNSLFSLRKFLEISMLYEYYKNANRSFVPLFFIAYHVFHKKISDKEILHFWDNYETGNADFGPASTWIYDLLLNGVFKSHGAGWDSTQKRNGAEASPSGSEPVIPNLLAYDGNSPPQKKPPPGIPPLF